AVAEAHEQMPVDVLLGTRDHFGRLAPAVAPHAQRLRAALADAYPVPDLHGDVVPRRAAVDHVDTDVVVADLEHREPVDGRCARRRGHRGGGGGCPERYPGST